MCVGVSDLPQDVLGCIFSHLSPMDLGSAAQVCRGWNSTSKLSWVCQNVARSVLDLVDPCDGSWKEQVLILRRWKTWKPQEVPLSVAEKRYGSEECYVLLDDNTVLGVVRPDSHGQPPFSVQNLFNHKELRQINVQQYGCADIFWGAIQGTIWTIRDINGKIFQFDIKTGDCINQFVGEAVEDGSSSDIYANDQEIILSVRNKVQIWDLQQHRFSQTFAIGEAHEIWDIWRICSTPNFVLCLAKTPGSMSLFAINKKDPSIQTRIEVGFRAEPDTFKSCGSYCSLLIGGALDVYEDTPAAQFKLVRTHRIQENSSPCRGSAQMYKNWVCVHKNDVFSIFDVRSGQEVLSLKKDWGLEVRFQVQAQALLVFHTFGTTAGPITSTRLCFYNFSRKIQQLPSGGRCVKY